MLAYAVASPCKLRQNLGEAGLLALAVRPSPTSAEAAARFAAVRASAASLCLTCRANVHEQRLGCAGLVPTPIARSTEAWLLDRLPRTSDSTAGAILASAVVDFEWDGRYAAALRGDRGRIFEAAEPLVQRGDSPTALGLTSDQAFDMLLGLAHVRRAHPLLLALAFGVIPHDTAPDTLGTLRTDPRALWPLLAAAALPTAAQADEHGAFGDLLRAVTTAAALEVELLVESN